MTSKNCFSNSYLPGVHETTVEPRHFELFFSIGVGGELIVLVHLRLKKFDPEDDEESLSNLEARCDVKQDSQYLNGSCTPLESIEYMESGELPQHLAYIYANIYVPTNV